MDHLIRDAAPITPHTWSLIEDEVTDALVNNLVGRQIFEVTEPLGWETSSIGSGRNRALKSGLGKDTELSVRQVQPLVEIRVPMTLARDELDALARGANDPQLDTAVTAARQAAIAEDRLVFEGLKGADITGAIDPGNAVKLPGDPEQLPGAIAEGINALRAANVSGPYALALAPEFYEMIHQATAGGYPVVKHVQRMIDSPIIWAPALKGGVLASLRGGDFKICLGADFAVGYAHHSKDSVELYLEELLTFENLAPEACIWLQPE